MKTCPSYPENFNLLGTIGTAGQVHFKMNELPYMYILTPTAPSAYHISFRQHLRFTPAFAVVWVS